MSDDPATLLYERDQARAEVQRLEQELAEARRLLAYADDAIRAEYQRFVDAVVNRKPADEVKP